MLDLYKGTPQWFYAQPYGFLVAAYVILAFPYIYFSLDSGFRAIDVAYAHGGLAKPRRNLAHDVAARGSSRMSAPPRSPVRS